MALDYSKYIPKSSGGLDYKKYAPAGFKNKADISTPEGLAQFAREKGFAKEAEKLLGAPKLSFLERLGRTLNAFEIGNALYQSRYEKKSFLGTYATDIFKGIQAGITGQENRETPKNTFKQILMKEGMNDRPGKLDVVDVVGLAADILTDPTTFFGGFITKPLAKGAKVAFKAGEKLPVAGKVLKGVREGAEDLFVPFANIKRTLGKQGDEYIQNFTKYVKGTRAEMDDFIGEVAVKAKSLKKVAPDAGKRIGEAVETGVRTGDKLLDEVMDSLVETQKAFTKQELTKGLLQHQLPDYMHHALTQDAADHFGNGVDLGQLLKPIRTRLGAAGKRKTTKFVSETGKEVFGEQGLKQVLRFKNKAGTIIEGTQDGLGLKMLQMPGRAGKQFVDKSGNIFTKIGETTKYLDPKGETFQRTISSVVEINKEFQKKHGFKLFEEDAFRAFGKRGIDSIKALNTHDFLERVGQQFGKKAEKDFIDELGIRYVSTGAKELAGYKVPEAIAKHIDETRKFLTNDEATNGFLKLYDNLHNFWKGTVTGYFPAFHTRNATGGVFNNWIAGLKDPTLYKKAHDVIGGAKGEITIKGGAKLSYDDIRKLLKENGVVGQTGYLDVRQFLQKEVSPTAGSKVTRLPQQIMGVIEDRLRTPLFMDGLQKGLSPEDAAKRVIKYHFDYMPEGFTAFEKNIMKRVIPFYTWTRHNIPLQLEQMIMQPGKYAAVFKAKNAFGVQPSSEEESILPRWLRERFTIKGEGGYWSGIGLPLEEATEKLSSPLRGFGTSLSPFLRVPIETLTGYNIFKEKRIDEDYYGKQYKNAPKFLKDWLELKENKTQTGKVYYTLNPQKRYWLEVIGSRGLSTALKVSNATDDKKNLMTLITTIAKYDYDIEDLKRWSDAEKRSELEKLLMQSGDLKSADIKYIPKK